MKILVTGAAGFIGSHLCEFLVKRGDEVVGIDNFDPFYSREEKERNLLGLSSDPGFTFIEEDILGLRSNQSIKEYKVDLVVHLAAKAGVLPSIKDPKAYQKTNIDGTFEVLEFMREEGIKKLVFGSSSSVYGNCPEAPFREDMRVSEPISPYALTKATNEMMTYNHYHLYGIDSVNLRFFTVIGPRQRPDLAIHKFFRMIRDGEPITIYGDGSSARDYTFVEDIISGILAAIDLVKEKESFYEIINLGNHRPIPLSRMIEVIEEISELPVKKVSMPFQAGDVDITNADISKARKLLGYDPKTPFEEGVNTFYNWFRSNPD